MREVSRILHKDVGGNDTTPLFPMKGKEVKYQKEGTVTE